MKINLNIEVPNMVAHNPAFGERGGKVVAGKVLANALYTSPDKSQMNLFVKWHSELMATGELELTKDEILLLERFIMANPQFNVGVAHTLISALNPKK